MVLYIIPFVAEQATAFRSSSMAEQAAVNRKVEGSNPFSGAKKEVEIYFFFYLILNSIIPYSTI